MFTRKALTESFRKFQKKFIVGYPDPLTPYVPSIEDPDKLVELYSDSGTIRYNVPENIVYKCENSFFCSMISQVEISQSITDGEEQKTETTAAELNSEDGVQASTGVAGQFGEFSIQKRITYVTEGEPEPVEVEYEFKNELYLASKSKGIILHENSEVSPHYFIDENDNGEMDEGEKIRLLFNLNIVTDSEFSEFNPASLSVERMGEVVTEEALGNDYSFTVDGRVVHIILGESTNLQPGDMIIFTESEDFHPDGEINEGHRCMGKVQEKPIQHLPR